MKKAADKIFLVGPMGAGKTTIGRLLAQELKLDFVDADLEIEKRCGADISWIFDVEGEAGFREREQKIIDELTASSQLVLATGGGAVLRPENRQNLSARGIVVYLMTTVSQQIERTRKDQKRPLLQKMDNPKEALSDMMSLRDPLYREIADIIVVTGRRSPRSVMLDIIAELQKEGVNE